MRITVRAAPVVGAAAGVVLGASLLAGTGTWAPTRILEPMQIEQATRFEVVDDERADGLTMGTADPTPVATRPATPPSTTTTTTVVEPEEADPVRRPTPSVSRAAAPVPGSSAMRVAPPAPATPPPAPAPPAPPAPEPEPGRTRGCDDPTRGNRPTDPDGRDRPDSCPEDGRGPAEGDGQARAGR